MKNTSENSPLRQSLNFLDDLAANNDRDSLNAHKPQQKEAQEEFKSFVRALFEGLVQFNPALAGQDPAKSIFRIYRDVRFSKDKRPYKTNFGVFLKKGGKKTPYAGYYFHLEPGKSFLAGGIYMPPNDILQKVRQEIDYNQAEIQELLSDNQFKKTFGTLRGDSLKRAPRGFQEDHPMIDLIKHKSFLMVEDLTPEQETAETILEDSLSTYRFMLPLNSFLNRAMD